MFKKAFRKNAFRAVRRSNGSGRMFGIWIVILFGIIPAGAGVGLTYALSKEESPPPKRLIIGGVIGAVIGLVLGIVLVQFAP